jgi:pilus assembly protein CpaE
MTQHRVLLAIADAELAGSASALAQEGEGLEVVDRIGDAEELARALRRLEVDVVILHDALGSVPVLEVARDIATSFPEVGLVLIAADDSTDLMRAAMQAGLRDVVSLPLSLEQLEGSVRAASQWSRTMRDRVAGEESAGAALGGQLIAVAGSKGGVGTTTVCLQLALAAVRAAPGRPVCVVDFDLQKGDFRSFLDMPYRRSVVDLVEVADEISVRHLQETLYTHKEGFRVLLAPDEGERAEEVNALAARPILSAVKARHALTIVDLGATVSEASAIGAELANRVLVVTQPDVASLRGVNRLLDLWKRLQVREEDEDVLVVLNRTSRKLEVQPDLARKVIAGRLAKTTIPAEFSAFEAAVNTGTPARMEDAKLRASFDQLLDEADARPVAGDEPDTDPSEPRGLLARLGGERGQSSAEMMGLLPVLIVIVLALWQVGLLGYTYLLAGHAAREGARELAVNTTDLPKDHPYRDAANRDLPKAWRKDAKIEVDEDDPVTVNVKLVVPAVLPGLKSPFKVSDHASTSVEDVPLPPSQTKSTPGSKS